MQQHPEELRLVAWGAPEHSALCHVAPLYQLLPPAWHCGSGLHGGHVQLGHLRRWLVQLPHRRYGGRRLKRRQTVWAGKLRHAADLEAAACLKDGIILVNGTTGTWLTAAHEIGHNLNAYHTFRYLTPLEGTWQGLHMSMMHP